MALYAKNIKTIDDLKQEKKRLLRERKQLEKEDLFSIDSILGGAIKETKGKKESSSEQDNLLNSIIPLVTPLAGTVFEILQHRFTGKKKTKSKNDEQASADPNLLISAAKELIGGYLKWKAIEFSYKGITMIIRKKKNKKTATQES